jgi:hypothetical protein
MVSSVEKAVTHLTWVCLCPRLPEGSTFPLCRTWEKDSEGLWSGGTLGGHHAQKS